MSAKEFTAWSQSLFLRKRSNGVLWALGFLLLWPAAAWGTEALPVVAASTDIKSLVEVVGGEGFG